MKPMEQSIEDLITTPNVVEYQKTNIMNGHGIQWI